MSDPDYDEIEQLIDGDPIELGRRLRAALAERDEARKEIGRLGRVQDQLLGQIDAQKETIRRLRAGLAGLQDWRQEVNDR